MGSSLWAIFINVHILYVSMYIVYSPNTRKYSHFIAVVCLGGFSKLECERVTNTPQRRFSSYTRISWCHHLFHNEKTDNARTNRYRQNRSGNFKKFDFTVPLQLIINPKEDNIIRSAQIFFEANRFSKFR